MGQKKKKGRLPKSDLSPPPSDNDLRRSLRRRNVKYVFDLDDYFDEDELFENDEDLRRRDKKLKHLLKLQSGELRSTGGGGITSRAEHAPVFSASSSESGENPSKKRKIIDEIDEDVDEENDDEITGEKPVHVAQDSNPGTPADSSQGLPLPEKKTLELILDKLQKKDIYGVYADPVDPEELPDYHDMIKHPMDFATVRKKLGNGSYGTLEQFEADVFLICSNAMQYNASDTIYHKQARSIKELALRKFQKIRLEAESSGKYLKSEQKLRSASMLKKPVQGFVINSQGPPASDILFAFSVDRHLVANAPQVVEFGRHGNADLVADGKYCINENTFDKGDESHPGKGLMSRFGKKSCMQDENRRETYAISVANNVSSSESLFSTFDGESRQLVPVGLYSDHSYARSLARFAASLGSIIWQITSKKIEQALPQGFTYGQGWVGEYEPLPTPVLIIENCKVKEPPFFTKTKPAAETKKYENAPVFVYSKENSGCASLPLLDRSGITSCSNPCFASNDQSPRVNASDMSSSFFLSSRINPNIRHQVSGLRTCMDSEQKGMNQFHQKVSLPFSTSAAQGILEMEAAKSVEFSSRNGKFSIAETFKQPDNGVASGSLSNGRVSGRLEGDNITSSSISMNKAAAGYYQQEQGHIMNDHPANVTRIMLAEKSQKHQSIDSRPQILSSAPISSGNGPTVAAATAAARAWMSVGAGGFRPPFENRNTLKNQISGGSPYHSPRDMQPQAMQHRGMMIQSDSGNSILHGFVPQGQIPIRVGNGVLSQNQGMVYPQVSASDLSRFQLQPTFRGLGPKMHESLPPDLNIGFQSSGSPGGPTSSILVDSQQPDLALQL